MAKPTVFVFGGSTTYTNTTGGIEMILGFTIGASAPTIKDANGTIRWTGSTTAAAEYKQLLFQGWILTMGGSNVGGYGIHFDNWDDLRGYI